MTQVRKVKSRPAQAKKPAPPAAKKALTGRASAGAAQSAPAAHGKAATGAGPKAPAGAAKRSATKPPAAKRASSAPSRDDGLRIVDATFLAGAITSNLLPPPICAEIAFAGRSNVGKSSLINSLVERKSLVRTSSTPGSTRQINLFETRAKDGTVLHLVDLPGYGFSRRSKTERAAWATSVESYLQQRPTLAAVVLLVDARRGLEEDDRDLIAFIESATAVSRRAVPVLVVATKADKLPRSSRQAVFDRLAAESGRRVVGYASPTGDGREALWRALRRAALGQTTPGAPIPEE